MSVGGLGRREKGSARLSEGSDSENEDWKSLSEASDSGNEEWKSLSDGSDSVGAFRWIMRVESKFGGSTPAYARQIIIFDGESDVTGVKDVKEVIEVKDDSWYSLDGRKLDGKPTKRGVYVSNGRKVVIK